MSFMILKEYEIKFKLRYATPVFLNKGKTPFEDQIKVSLYFCISLIYVKLFCNVEFYHHQTWNQDLETPSWPFLPMKCFFCIWRQINRNKLSTIVVYKFIRLIIFSKPESKFNRYTPLFILIENSLKRFARTHLIDLAWRDRIAHGWNFEIASLPGQSPYDRSSWSWKQWQGPVARSSTHRQWHTRTLLFFPTHLLACSSIK